MYGYLSAIQELPVTGSKLLCLQKNNNACFNLNRCSSATCIYFEVWNANYMYGDLDVNLIWEKAHSHKAVAPVICSLIQICFKVHQNSESLNLISSTRCIVAPSQSSFYSWPPWVFLSEPLLPSPFIHPSPPPVPTHVHICPICKSWCSPVIFHTGVTMHYSC